MDADNILPTCGQLERHISQTLQASYRSEFGHLPPKIVCHLFGDKLAIVVENIVTDIEKILLDNSQSDLALNVRKKIDETFLVDVKQQIPRILGVEVIDTIADSVLPTGYLGMILFLSDSPKVRVSVKENPQYAQSNINI